MQMGTRRSPTIILKGISEIKSSALNSKISRSFLLFKKHRQTSTCVNLIGVLGCNQGEEEDFQADRR